MKMFDGKTRMIVLPYGEKKTMTIKNVKPFSSDTGTSRTNGQTDRIAISISRVSVLTHDRNLRRFITRSHGRVTSVVRATRQVNGRRQTFPSHHTHTP